MDKIIEQFGKKLREIAEGKPQKPIKEDMGEEITASFVKVIIYSLQWASVGYQSALRLGGMKLGRRLGEESEKTEFSLVLEEVKNILTALRGGKIEVEIMPEAEGAEVKIYNSLYTEGIPNVLQKLCFFEEGFIEGYLDGVISRKGALAIAGGDVTVGKISVEEKRCIGLGDDHCRFLLKF